MRAMVLERPRSSLELRDVTEPTPTAGQLLLRVRTCGICRTDLHVIDGELAEPKLPLIPGHQIVGEVVAASEGVTRFAIGARVGVPWLGWSCGRCDYCTTERENLCGEARYTGYTLDGGFADFAVADARFCFPLPESYSDVEAAPLLCAGLIGYRAFRMAGDARRLGFYGFGAAAHILTPLARHLGREVYAFTRPGDEAAQTFARKVGAVWAGDSSERPPVELDAAILFAPDGRLIPIALQATARGGVVICAGIHMSDIPSFPYSILWEERVVRSVANLTRRDGEEFLALAPQVPIRPETRLYPLERTNEAHADLREGRLSGAAVIAVGASIS